MKTGEGLVRDLETEKTLYEKERCRRDLRFQVEEGTTGCWYTGPRRRNCNTRKTGMWTASSQCSEREDLGGREQWPGKLAVPWKNGDQSPPENQPLRYPAPWHNPSHPPQCSLKRASSLRNPIRAARQSKRQSQLWRWVRSRESPYSGRDVNQLDFTLESQKNLGQTEDSGISKKQLCF